MDKFKRILTEKLCDVRNEFVQYMASLFVVTLFGGVQGKVAIEFCIEENRESGLETIHIVERGPVSDWYDSLR
jgi:hypothetical protein